MYKILLLLVGFWGLVSCANNTADTKAPISKEQKKP